MPSARLCSLTQRQVVDCVQAGSVSRSGQVASSTLEAAGLVQPPPNTGGGHVPPMGCDGKPIPHPARSALSDSAAIQNFMAAEENSDSAAVLCRIRSQIQARPATCSDSFGMRTSAPHFGISGQIAGRGYEMKQVAVLALVLAGCTASEGPPAHPLVGNWEGTKSLTLGVTDYTYGGTEYGAWTADRSSFKYAKSNLPSNKQERCVFSLAGRELSLTDCRIAGRFTRVQ